MTELSQSDENSVRIAHANEVAEGQRFSFGKNWRAFLSVVNEERVQEAVISLQDKLGVADLKGMRFLDIGSGSGLFSLAAHRLGAHVTSFDFDTDSVECTLELRRRFAASDKEWRIFQGSVLDEGLMAGLGQFDIVYSWGVLHHTGSMWTAIDNAVRCVDDRGTLFIAIYNDQGAWSRRWKTIKQWYCSGPIGKLLVSVAFISYWVSRDFVADIVWRRNPLTRYSTYGKNRGMSVVRDWHDWLGGYPFEVAKPEDIILALAKRGFAVRNLVTAGGSVGCVEYVLSRSRD
jgi:2-polyprenyl-3-methyl-5-hydroxy-6-metoxy-1,4-benzoquinol methylase